MTHGGALLCVFFQVHFVGQNVEEFVFLPVLEPLLRLCGAELRHMEQQVRPTPATTRGLGGHSGPHLARQAHFRHPGESSRAADVPRMWCRLGRSITGSDAARGKAGPSGACVRACVRAKSERTGDARLLPSEHFRAPRTAPRRTRPLFSGAGVNPDESSPRLAEGSRLAPQN